MVRICLIGLIGSQGLINKTLFMSLQFTDSMVVGGSRSMYNTFWFMSAYADKGTIDVRVCWTKIGSSVLVDCAKVQMGGLKALFSVATMNCVLH
jgi:hypothetical protein